MNGSNSNRVRFGPFEVDLRTREVWKDGIEQKIVGQPFEILALLITRPGDLVTRDELRSRLWVKDTFVDFDHGLNAAVNKLREALGDSADNPKFIQTLPRQGYRFIAPVATTDGQTSTPASTLPPSAVALPSIATHPKRSWPKFATAALVVALLAVLLTYSGYSYLTRPRSVPTDPLKPVPFTTMAGNEWAPSFSPDGNSIAFARTEAAANSGADIYVRQIGNDHAIRLTNHKAWFVAPRWSPDGRNIAFAMHGAAGRGIYLMPALGGPERQLVAIDKHNYPWSYISWSADSRRIAFAQADSPSVYHIHILEVETGEQTILPVASPDCLLSVEPAFSPDGKSLAYACVLISSGGNRIYVQSLDGITDDVHNNARHNNGDQNSPHASNVTPREITSIRSDAFALDGVTWTADSQSILYGNQGTLWRVSAAGGIPQRELPLAHDAENATVALVGNRLAYVQTTFDLIVWSLDLATPIRPAGPPVKLIASKWRQGDPRISPDGKHIAFESWRSGSHEVWVCDRDGSNPIQVSFFGNTVTGTPQWSPDSRMIAFDSATSGRSQVYVVSATGGRPQQLPTGTSSASTPFFSADGRWIYFSTDQPAAIWKVPVEGGQAVLLTRKGAYPRESVDGKRLFYVVGRDPSTLWSVSPDGGDEHIEEGFPALWLDTAWTPAPGGIYFVPAIGTHDALNFFDFATRQVHKVSDLPVGAGWGGLGISSDGRNLLYTAPEPGDSSIMLVDGFR